MDKMQRICIVAILALIPALVYPQANEKFGGEWELLKEKSTEIDLWSTLSLDITVNGSDVTIIHQWGKGRSHSDTLDLETGGKANKIPIGHRVWPTNVFMGIEMPIGKLRKIKAYWEKDGSVLRLEQTYPVRGSQGDRKISSTHTYRYSPPQNTIIYTIERDTRENEPPLRYEFKRKGTRYAYYMRPADNWSIDGKLPENAFLISLQGVANTRGPRLYFIYPNWPFTYTPHVFDFYNDEKNYTFQELRTPAEALDSLKDAVEGYVVWDTDVRTSLIVSFTVAGLEKAVVVTGEQIPMMKKAGLEEVEDFRGRFTGMTDAEIYQWAYDQYWDRCAKDLIIWMGGPGGDIMKPGVADWGIYNKAFFNDLSARPADSAEYALADRLLSEMKPMSMVMGWHSYVKDKEREHVTLTSKHGHRVEGLHTLPNVSFSHQIPPTPGFEYTNNHNIDPDKEYIPEKKVYITCVQTDGLGLGAWTKPGRGEIPYAWETIMNYKWLAPAMLEFFYTQATPNDYFIGALSGPGYMYPKAVPKDTLDDLVGMAYDMMQDLDIRVFEIMDYSEGATVEGNTELSKEVVDIYYEEMPDALGFINGYAPAFTFAIKDNTPLISYDYYLSPTRPVEQAVADLHELAAVNEQRPYFLLMHVRESSNIQRVKSILDKLNPEFELVPLDVFLKYAGNQPTFQEKFLKDFKPW